MFCGEDGVVQRELEHGSAKGKGDDLFGSALVEAIKKMQKYLFEVEEQSGV